jgi:ribosomal-protein-serine acetyltransferase
LESRSTDTVSARTAFALDDGRELRLLEESDAPELHALVEENRAHLAAWMHWVAGQTERGTLEFIRETRAQHQSGDGFQGAIVDHGRIVGAAGMHRIDWPNRSVELGYWLSAREQGHGIMTSAVEALVRHAFEQLELNRVQICAAVQNHRSRALIERLGFRLEGVAREHYRVGDAYHDDAVYAMIASDWRDARASR